LCAHKAKPADGAGRGAIGVRAARARRCKRGWKGVIPPPHHLRRLAGTLDWMQKFEEGEPIGKHALDMAHEFYGGESPVRWGGVLAMRKAVALIRMCRR
jgi:hypothetical protein